MCLRNFSLPVLSSQRLYLLRKIPGVRIEPGHTERSNHADNVFKRFLNQSEISFDLRGWSVKFPTSAWR